MTANTLRTVLARLLEEPAAQVEHRVRHTLDAQLAESQGRVVLFGAGGLGRQTLACLRTIGIEPLAMSDNNRARWGTQIDGVNLLSPVDAAANFGADALFIVTIWNPYHWFQHTRRQLMDLGCHRITAPSPVYWRFPDAFLPFFAQDLPQHVYEHADAILRAAAIWSDDRSRQQFLEQVRWRAQGRWEFSPPCDEDKESYFLPRVFRLDPEEVFVDCGAFDGDTLGVFLSLCRGAFKQYVAVEPDPASCSRLETLVAALPADVRARITCVRCAVGSRRGMVTFSGTGGLGSKESPDGDLTVPCMPISELVDPSAHVSFIKMDIEGAELDALTGAREIIERDGPILAICVYHSQRDVWTLPLSMKQMLPGHHMFLRCHEGDGWQTVAYAVPTARLAQGVEP